MSNLAQLYPLPTREIPLIGAFLAHNVRQYAEDSGRAFVYSNFIVSLDGRIAVPHPGGEGLTVPETTANERDWRLFQELAAQADIIISSSRYLRDWADGRAQEILQVDDPRFADLRAWRQNRGLPPHPDIAIVSGSLRFPIPGVIMAGERRVVVFTTANPAQDRVREIERRVGRVYVAGEKNVEGAAMVQRLAKLGYETIFSTAGPKILHLLLAARVLDRLYLTHANRILGGQPYAGIVEGPLFDPPYDLTIDTVYLDADALQGLGQLFVSYRSV